MNINKCIECEAYHGHHPKCSLIDFSTAKEMMIQYYEVWLNMETKHLKHTDKLYKMISTAKKEAEFWKGKFVVVKNENNKLRINKKGYGNDNR